MKVTNITRRTIACYHRELALSERYMALGPFYSAFSIIHARDHYVAIKLFDSKILPRFSSPRLTCCFSIHERRSSPRDRLATGRERRPQKLGNFYLIALIILGDVISREMFSPRNDTVKIIKSNNDSRLCIIYIHVYRRTCAHQHGHYLITITRSCAIFFSFFFLFFRETRRKRKRRCVFLPPRGAPRRLRLSPRDKRRPPGHTAII